MHTVLKILFPIWIFFIFIPYLYYLNYRLILTAGHSRKKVFILALFPMSILLIKRTPQLKKEAKRLSPWTHSLAIAGLLLFFLSNIISHYEH